MDRKNKPSGLKAWLVVLIALLDDVAILALVAMILVLLDVELPVPVLAVIGLMLVTIIFFAHRAVIRSLRERTVTGVEAMIGATGKVTECLNPAGMVMINGEYWKAVSRHGKIDMGCDVEVLGISGLALEVKEKNHE